jgi:hypothetical protein
VWLQNSSRSSFDKPSAHGVRVVMEEIFKPIPGYEGRYEVSNIGRVKSCERISPTSRGNSTKVVKSRMLKLHQDKKGYMRVSLLKYGKYDQWLVHRLVLLTFVGSSELQVDHINAVRWDNRLENLEYVTGRENQTRRYKRHKNLPVGVSFIKRKFQARITVNKTLYVLGSYHSEKEASEVYKNALQNLDSIEELAIRKKTSTLGTGVSSTPYNIFVTKVFHKGKVITLGRYKDLKLAQFSYILAKYCISIGEFPIGLVSYDGTQLPLNPPQ